MLPDAGHKSPHPTSSLLQSVGGLGLMDAQGLLLGLLPPQTWQDQSTLQGTIALRQVPPCCSSHTEELTPTKPPGEASKVSLLPTSCLPPHPYLPTPGPRAPFPKWDQTSVLSSLDAACILSLGYVHPCKTWCWLHRAQFSPRRCSGEQDSPKRAPHLPAHALAGSRRMEGPG